MKDFFLVAVVYSLEQLIGETLDDHRVHSFFFAESVHKLLEIIFKVFENEYEFTVSVDNFPKPYDIRVG